MKIDKEKFNQLKQLDRIEYRQKLILINDIGNDSFRHIFAAIIILMFSGFFIFVNLTITFLGFFLSFFIFILAIVELVLYIKCNVDLPNEYFKVEVKK